MQLRHGVALLAENNMHIFKSTKLKDEHERRNIRA